jgi:hypothetical protein
MAGRDLGKKFGAEGVQQDSKPAPVPQATPIGMPINAKIGEVEQS